MLSILQIHNKYKIPGGEEQILQMEYNQIIINNKVGLFICDNNDISNFRLRHAISAIWNFSTPNDVNKYRNIYDVIHIHNTFPQISPSVYSCFENTPIIQTLHNYRLLCPNALLLQNNIPCEKCKGKYFAWHGVKNKCYRNSFAATFVTALMLSFHKLIGTWKNQVDVYIALTDFARQKFIEGGLPAEKIVVKPNFIDPDPGVKTNNGDFALFVGRLSPEKGVKTIVRAWEDIAEIPVIIIGDGPLQEEIVKTTVEIPSIKITGRLDHEQVIDRMKNAKFLVLPSECYENFPLTIVEAYACGLPVIASRLGAMAELVHDGVTGLFFEPGNPHDLAEKVRWAWEHPQEMAVMGKNARKEYEAKYTAEKNYEMLMDIYQKAIDNRKARVNGKRRSASPARI